MNLKKIKEYIDNLLEYTPINLDYEFDADLESHNMGNQNIYRLYYIDYRRCGGYYLKDNNIHMTDWPFKPFILPKKMNREDAFKVLSYLTDYIEKTLNLRECSYESVRILNDLLDLDRLGFIKLNIDANRNLDKIIDLYTVAGRILLFKKSEHYPRYVEWYTEGVTFEEVKEIYEKIGIEFYDINFEEKTKKLEMK